MTERPLYREAFFEVRKALWVTSGRIKVVTRGSVLATCTVEVAEGDVLEIQVNTYDPANMWANPAGTVTVTAAFE